MAARQPQTSRAPSHGTVLRAAALTFACMLLSVAFCLLAFRDLPEPARLRAVVSALMLPSLVGFPLFLVGGLRRAGLEAHNRNLLRLAATDGLTRCLNRTAFTRHVARRVTSQSAPDTCGGALLIIDADHFKRVNDRHGHQAGDRALELIADAIRRSVRQGDLVGRMGGEEFAVLLPDVTTEAAARVAERLRSAVETSVFGVAGRHHRITVSIGGVVYDRAHPFEALFKQADARLYQAKRGGRNRIDLAAFQM